MSSRPFPIVTVGDLIEVLEEYPDHYRVFLTASMIEGTSPNYTCLEWVLENIAFDSTPPV